MTLPSYNPSKSDSQNQTPTKSRRDKKWEALHISAPAMAIAVLIYVAALYGASLISPIVGDTLTGYYVVAMLLLATFFCFH